jgi:uroporphyrinogen decarboxylase
VIGIDWATDIAVARRQAAGKAVQGNLDPCVLFAPKEKIEQEVERVLKGYGSGPGHIFNLGHGILPSTSPENAKYLVDRVKALSVKYHERAVSQ